MATYCIPPKTADILNKAIKDGDVVGDIAKLYEMTSDQRRDAFAKHVGNETAKLINAEFERSMASNKKKALVNWAKKTFTPETKKNGQYKSALDTITEMDDQGLLTPETEDAFLKDLVGKKLGISISPEEAQVISDKVKEIERLSGELSEIGLPTAEYFKARSELENYILSQHPAARLRVATSTIGRTAMLASFKSPILNIESNTVQGVLTAFERRLSSGQYQGLNSKYAKKYVKENFKIYQKSGYDLSRLISFSDDRKILGEEITHSQGPGTIRKIGRFAEDVVFKQMMGAPDVVFSAVHFADSANLSSTKIAKEEGLKGREAKKRALEIFQDAVKVEPRTIEGETVRAQAIADAENATYTNKSTYSDVALAIRKVFNVASGNFRLGDQIMPFVKTPANVVGAGIDYSAVALPAQIYLLPKAIQQMRNGEKAAFQRSMRTIVRSGLGLTFAFVLSSLFDPEDFIGNYPVSKKEQELLELKNATTNSIRIGNKWVSLDYFGVLSAPLVGMMYAKKYAHTPAEAVVKYYQGVITQTQKIPGVKDFADLYKDITDFTNEAKTGQKELTTAATNAIIDYIRSRSVPAIVNDIAKATDTKERVADIKKDPLARIKSSIPWLRQTLPEKKTVFGETIQAESAMSTLLFGSRVKTAQDNKLVKEFVRLESEGQLPSITEVEQTSSRVKELKVQIGDQKFNQAMGYYRDLFKKRTERIIETGKYKRMNDEDKKKEIDNIKNDALDQMLKKYRYKKPRK